MRKHAVFIGAWRAFKKHHGQEEDGKQIHQAGHHSQVVQIGGHVLRDQAQQENQQESDDENKNGNQDEFSAQIAVMQAAHGDRQIEEDIEPRHGCQKLQGKHAQLSGLVEKVKGGIEAGVSQQDQSILRMGGI